MHLKALLLKNFRNYQEETFFFTSGMNLIYGNNGHGKTNLLEAIYLLSTGRSFRTARYQDLIHHDEKYFYLEARFANRGIEQTIKIYYDKINKNITYNHNQFKVFSQLLGILPSVLIAPGDIHIIEGAPEKRRRFMNIHQAQIDPFYGYHLTRYFKALKQRNVLLKKSDPMEMDVWEHELSRSAIYLIQKRSECIQRLESRLKSHLEHLSPCPDYFSIAYSSSLPQTSLEECQQFFRKSREKDRFLQNTQHGPHRDDLHFLHDQKQAKYFASEGQKRTALLALKFAEWQHLQDQMNIIPIFIIDDFTMHLDPERLSLLSHRLQSLGQVFLSAPEEISVTAFRDANKLHISNGKWRKYVNSAAPFSAET